MRKSATNEMADLSTRKEAPGKRATLCERLLDVLNLPRTIHGRHPNNRERTLSIKQKFCEGINQPKNTVGMSSRVEWGMVTNVVTGLLHSRSPHLTTHSLSVLIVVIWLRAVWSADVVVLIIHAVLSIPILWFRVYVTIISSSRRRKSLLGG